MTPEGTIIEERLAAVLPLDAGSGSLTQILFRRDIERNPPPDADAFSRMFDQANVSFFSQNGEDGILQFLLAQVKDLTYRSVEIGAGDGIENNTTNLLVHHGYRGLLVDPSWALEYIGTEFFRRVHTTQEHPPVLRREFAEVDNVNDLVSSAGFAGDIDVLSIDVDGNDFWIFEALTVVNPTVVVLELNLQLGPEAAVAMPYNPGYSYWDEGKTGYIGASVRGFDALARRRGLVFVGCDRKRVNGFWVRRGAISAVPDGVPLDRIWTWDRVESELLHQQHLLEDFSWTQIPDPH